MKNKKREVLVFSGEKMSISDMKKELESWILKNRCLPKEVEMTRESFKEYVETLYLFGACLGFDVNRKSKQGQKISFCGIPVVLRVDEKRRTKEKLKKVIVENGFIKLATDIIEETYCPFRNFSVILLIKKAKEQEKQVDKKTIKKTIKNK